MLHSPKRRAAAHVLPRLVEPAPAIDGGKRLRRAPRRRPSGATFTDGRKVSSGRASASTSFVSWSGQVRGQNRLGQEGFELAHGMNRHPRPSRGRIAPQPTTRISKDLASWRGVHDLPSRR